MTTAPRVVLFDLFNTLIPGGSRGERDAVSRQIAGDLDVDPDALAALMFESFETRMRGELGEVEETLAGFSRQLGRDPDERALAVAVERRLALTRGFHAQTWALPALEAFRADGWRLGLVSDCSAETPAVWNEGPLAPYFAATSFSCETGVRKPDPLAYLTATRALGVDPATCVYVGDGESRELTGATALGMTVFRHVPPGSDPLAVVAGDPEWEGPYVTELMELLPAVQLGKVGCRT